ncbi:MAG: aminotransferase class III-fold pyridoxal phosphate-dependent enzyme [Candidatus Thermoplasmatota archaeon]|nr:aminotransferase class III-fold pyridoxal phosphate-dependent enzyme [Candidatus Thermoplasmatota archaeon]
MTDLTDLLEARNRHISMSLSIGHGKPLHIVKGELQYLYADDGTRFLDLVNNVCHVGHCHPKVVAAGQQQMSVLSTNTRYVYDGLTEYISRLAATLPNGLDVGFMVNSGSEANELAVRLARAHTGENDMLVVDGGYHGNTSMLVQLSPYKFLGPGGKGVAEAWVHVVPVPDQYRREGIDYNQEIKDTISKAGNVAGFLIEPMLSCAGQIPLPDGFLKTAQKHTNEAGGLLIVDEVQVGFGRVGTHMWAFESQDVVPDIVVLGKSIGNGHPMAAVFTTKEIASSLGEMEWFSSTGGNPVSCAIGNAVLDVIEEEELLKWAEELGEYFMAGLQKLQQKYPVIGDVRGRGLFIGIEFVSNSNTLQPDSEEASRVVREMRDCGVLLSTDGPHHNVIKIKPPMVLTKQDIDMTLNCLNDVLRGDG